MYEERFYRGIAKPPDLACYEVKIKETDLLCCTAVNIEGFIKERVLFYRNQLEEYIRIKPAFKDSLVPVGHDLFAPIMVRKMIETSQALGIGPMATVAGAMAEFVGNDIAHLSNEYVIENGGDISLFTERTRLVMVYAKDSPFSGRIAIRIRPDDEPYGVCTSSGTVGPSMSFGMADAVCILGRSALFADGLATKVGNAVKKKEDIPQAIDEGKVFPGVIGILVIFGDHIGLWGDMEITGL
ncbi:MAG: UPF0280 family protein [Syntrophobacterales bacterium]|jgi:ApbE superfamily uncharacterized protein (UPF0280 family)|nr:UPF0280 family protein [Syntrophobacterales bacterium]